MYCASDINEYVIEVELWSIYRLFKSQNNAEEQGLRQAITAVTFHMQG